MANVYSIAFSVVGIIGIHSCLVIWTALLLPQPVERARARLKRTPLASFFWGLLFSLITAAVVGGFFLVRMQNIGRVAESLEFLAENFQFQRFYNDAWIITNVFLWLLAAPILAGVIVGGAGFAQLFAARARLLMREDRPLVALTWGAVCTSASYFMPLVGWFVFLPIVGLMSVGAGVCGILGRRTPQADDA